MGKHDQEVAHYREKVRLNDEMIQAHDSGFMGFPAGLIGMLRATNDRLRRILAAWINRNDA